MSLWIGLGVAVWLALAVILALLIGKIIRQRDEQRPHLHSPHRASPDINGK